MAAVPPLTFDLDISELRQSELAALAARLLPHILHELRALAPAEARAIAGEAAAHRPLDGVSLASLADWLRDQQFDGLAEQVAAIDPAGRFLIFQLDQYLPPASLKTTRQEIEKCLPEGVRAMLLPFGLNLVGITPKE